uniref:Uncharacterized protein n=1 Tax=Panagrolaimus davidi TaxID=227884 RepID=A0A914QML2_9BILA
MNAHERKSVNPELQVWIKENVHSSKILFTGKADDCARVEALVLHFYFNNKLDNLQLFNKRQEHRQLLINEQYIKVDEDIEIFLQSFPLNNCNPGYETLLEAVKHIVFVGGVKDDVNDV